MSLSNPRGVFGIHSVTPYKINTREFYGTWRVLASSSLNLTGETIDLLGGSSKYPWDSEVATITAEMALSFREYPDWMYEVLMGSKATTNTALSASEVKDVEDKNGEIISGGSVSGVTVDNAADLKFGQYTCVAATSTTLDVYISSTVDLSRGTKGEILDDSMAILKGADATSDITPAGWGFTIGGNAGTTAMTAGDTFTFNVQTENESSMDAVIGGASDSFPSFGAIIMAQKRGDNKLFEIDAYSCKAAGAPIGMTENEWSQAEVTVKMNYDSSRDGVFSIRSLD